MTVERIVPPLAAQEREVLEAWLDFQRDTLALKCDGLTGDQLRERAVPPSSLSLLGLVRHMAEGERQWFKMVLGREQIPYHYYTDDDPEAEFDVDGADVAEACETWREESSDARQRTAAAAGLDVTASQAGTGCSLRRTMLHTIEACARHHGHADLIRA